MFRFLIAIFATLTAAAVSAQTAPLPSTTTSPALPAAISHAPLPLTKTCCEIVAGTLLSLETMDLLNSSQRKRGDKFGLRVVVPYVVDGVEIIPAGTTGIGEVVHAAAARGGGAPGELLIAARSLDISGQTVPLRGLKLGVTGGDNTGMALGVSFAAGPFAMFVRGREIEIPASTRVEVKVASTLNLRPVDPADSTQTLPKSE